MVASRYAASIPISDITTPESKRNTVTNFQLTKNKVSQRKLNRSIRKTHQDVLIQNLRPVKKRKSKKQQVSNLLNSVDPLTGKLRSKKVEVVLNNQQVINLPAKHPSNIQKLQFKNNDSLNFKKILKLSPELYSSLKRSKDYLNEQKSNAKKLLGFSLTNNSKHNNAQNIDILDEASQINSDMRKQSQDGKAKNIIRLENSFLYKAIEFMKSWKGVAVIIVGFVIYLFASAFLSRGSAIDNR